MKRRLDGNSERVRIGLTGLALVFVLVLLATVFSKATDEEPITANRIEAVAAGRSAAPANTVTQDSNEPLAELGVAPGNAPEAQNKASAGTVQVEDPLRTPRRR